MTPVSTRVGGVWKDVASVHTKVSGSWKTAADMPVKVGGVWKTGILSSTAFESIATVNGSGTTSVTFSSIPTTYQHLQLRIASYRNTATIGNSQMKMRFNGDTGSNYWVHEIAGNGTTVTASGSNDVSAVIGRQANDLNSLSVFIVDIHNYAITTQNKVVRAFSGYDLNGSGNIYLLSSLWLNTDAISSIQIYNPTFSTNSTFALYGIKGA